MAGTRAFVRGSFREELLVGVALEVGPGGRPLLFVDQVDDEAFEFRGVLDAVLGLAEDDSEGARLLR